MISEKFKNMTAKEKIEHIWEYYKLHIFSVIFIIAALSVLINNYIINPPPDIYCNIAIYSDSVSSDTADRLVYEITPEDVNLENINQQIVAASYYVPESEPEIANQLQIKFQTLSMANMLDIIIADEHSFRKLIEQGFIIELSEVFTTDELNILNDDKILFNYTFDDKVQNFAYGINLKNTDTVLKNNDNYKNGNRYVGVIRNSEKKENAKKIIFKLINYNNI